MEWRGRGYGGIDQLPSISDFVHCPLDDFPFSMMTRFEGVGLTNAINLDAISDCVDAQDGSG